MEGNKKYPYVPGKGMLSAGAKKQRLDFLAKKGFDLREISESRIPIDDLGNNIESLIGSVEIPVAVAGPLRMIWENEEEWVHVVVGTLEGALVASMNRGARVVSMCSGISTHVLHQKMIRSPMVVLGNLSQAIEFKRWVDSHFRSIKGVASKYSNHAVLERVETLIAGRSVHLNFVYTTGDASGQNMTTTCTWNALLWIEKNFNADLGIMPKKVVIEGNGSSDKKVSYRSMSQGRGTHVVAECEIEETYLNRILRTTSHDFIECYNASLTMSRINGMVGYNINVANAIASIFVTTGQDLASIHESSVGILNVEKTERGLYFSLHLPNLVIGTVGGGTHLKCQAEALQLCGCLGNGTAHRFARIIAGFALSLEISTFAAIVGGQFAAAHERMGRNKPKRWLIESEINTEFVRSSLLPQYQNKIESIKIDDVAFCEDGILMNLAHKATKKKIGFTVLDAHWNSNKGIIDLPQKLLIKSKPLDKEAVYGLHLMAAAIDTPLARLLSSNEDNLEYKNCHLKEIAINEQLSLQGFSCVPKYYGKVVDVKREIHLFIQEFLEIDKLRIFNSENSPEVWTQNLILNVLNEIHKVHVHLDQPKGIKIDQFNFLLSIDLYERLIEVVLDDYSDTTHYENVIKIKQWLEDLKKDADKTLVDQVIIHNDLNTRNVAIRQDKSVCIYDWELAVVNIPQRDVVEFLSFVLESGFEPTLLKTYVNHHIDQWSNSYSAQEIINALVYAAKEYLITRVLFYVAGKIVIDFEFAERVFFNTIRMLDILEEWE